MYERSCEQIMYVNCEKTLESGVGRKNNTSLRTTEHNSVVFTLFGILNYTMLFVHNCVNDVFPLLHMMHVFFHSGHIDCLLPINSSKIFIPLILLMKRNYRFAFIIVVY